MNEEKIKTLARFLQVEIDEINKVDDETFEYGNEEYLVLTDEEADANWEEKLDNYIDEVILPDILECYRNYFDEEKWKDDARIDGRGYCLATYDSCENEQDDYYIYRI